MAKLYSAQGPGLQVDREKRRINGVAIISKSVANGDVVDDQTLQMFAQLGAAGGIRARFDHPEHADPFKVEQTLKNLLGEHVNFRVDGDTLRADAQFTGVNAELEETIFGLAEKSPHLFGLSVVFDDAPAPKGKKSKAPQPCRPAKLFAADFVDIPAANSAGLFSAKAEEKSKRMDPLDVYAKDGKCFAMADGKEYELRHTTEALAMLNPDPDNEDEPEKDAAKKAKAAKGQGEALTSADIEKKSREARDGERARRKKFSSMLATAGVTGKDTETFEELYEQDMDEKQLESMVKLFASRALGNRAKPLGEGSGEKEKKETEKDPLAEVETEAGKRFDDEPQVRSMYGVNLRDPASDAYKSARGRHIAAARRRHQSEK